MGSLVYSELCLYRGLDYISRIPPRSQVNDEITWHLKNNGLFIVKLAYHLAISFLIYLPNRDNHHPWCKYRGFFIPQKIKHFIWRACNDVISTRANLRKRSIDIDAISSLCNLVQETTSHCFMFCDILKRIWFASHLALRLFKYHNLSLVDWFMNWFKLEKSPPLVNINIVASIIIYCSFIWKFRNDVVFGKENVIPSKIIFDSCRIIQELNEIQEGQEEGSRMVGTSFWSPPSSCYCETEL